MKSAERIRVVHPLFQAEGGGSTPTSALQLHFGWTTVEKAVDLNALWHSRLPAFTSPPEKCKAICAEYDGVFYAAAIWSDPVARRLNWTGRYELRRFAIAPDAPRNTGSRMLRVMRLMIERKLPQIQILMSYQDTEMHDGTIYRAAGWHALPPSKIPQEGWHTRKRAATQTNAHKIRWELDLRAALGEEVR